MIQPERSAPNADAGSQRQAVWSRYWAALPTGAASGSFAGGYEGSAIGSWWVGWMREPRPGARWLDLATGNGAVPRLWSQAPAAAGRMTAVDLAQLHLPWVETLAAELRARMAWHSGVNVAALPFADASFDVVTSQFGVEYADLPRVVDEALRVLAPAGRLLWVLHVAKGRPVELARAEVGYIDGLLGARGLWQSTLAMVVPMSRLSDPRAAAMLAHDPSAQAARRAHDAALAWLQTQAATSPCPDVLLEAQDAAAQVLATAVQQGPDAALGTAGRWRRQLEDSRFRLAELLAHALTDTATRALVDSLAARGYRVTTTALLDQDFLMAIALDAQRP